VFVRFVTLKSSRLLFEPLAQQARKRQSMRPQPTAADQDPHEPGCLAPPNRRALSATAASGFLT